MEQCQNSTKSEFFILAFYLSRSVQCILFSGVLLVYLMTVLGNMVIVALVCLVPQLHTPMYYFLSNLAVADFIHVSVTLPKLLSILLTQDKRMSFSTCMIQVFFFSLSIIIDIFVLTTMSYDRCVAICKPLQYSVIMRKCVYRSISLCSWVISGINAAVNGFITSLLSFCRTKNVDHFFCDQKTLCDITSSDPSSRYILMLCQDVFFVSLPFLLIITSYVFIMASILKIKSSNGRMKAFSSCTSHLTTVILFFGLIIAMYAKPESKGSKELDKLLTLLYTAVVPMLNPFVYTLRNKDIINAVRNLKKRNFILLCK